MRRVSLIGVILAVALVVAACGSAAPLPPGGHPRLTSITMLSAIDGWAAGEGGALLRYHNGTWTRVDDPSGADLYGIAMASPTDGWAVGQDPASGKGVILRAAGGQWQADTPLTVPTLRDITLVSPTEGWAVGDGGTILHLSGGHWASVASPSSADLMAVTMLSPSAGWATGYDLINTPNGSVYDSVVLRYTAGQWSVAATQANARLYGIAATPNDEWVVGASAQGEGTILYGVRGIWTPAGGHIHPELTGVTLDAPTDGWAVGVGGALVHETNGRWTLLPPLVAADLYGIAMLSPTEGWAVGDQQTILRCHNGVWRVFSQ